MRFATASFFYLVGSALARPILSPRDDSVVKYNINRVGNAITTLESILARGKPRPRDDRAYVVRYFNSALTANDKVVYEMRASAEDVRRSRNKLTDFESANLAVNLMGQESTVVKIVDHWIDVRRDARDVNLNRDVLDGLLRAQSEINHFSDALIQKLSNMNQALGKNRKARTSGHLDKAVKEYRRG
jgi:hypothetical protein